MAKNSTFTNRAISNSLCILPILLYLVALIVAGVFAYNEYRRVQRIRLLLSLRPQWGWPPFIWADWSPFFFIAFGVALIPFVIGLCLYFLSQSKHKKHKSLKISGTVLATFSVLLYVFFYLLVGPVNTFTSSFDFIAIALLLILPLSVSLIIMIASLCMDFALDDIKGIVSSNLQKSLDG